MTFKNSGDNSNPEVYSQLENGHQLAVNSPGAIGETEIIPIVVEAGAEGTVSLMLDEDFQPAKWTLHAHPRHRNGR